MPRLTGTTDTAGAPSLSNRSVWARRISVRGGRAPTDGSVQAAKDQAARAAPVSRKTPRGERRIIVRKLRPRPTTGKGARIDQKGRPGAVLKEGLPVQATDEHGPLRHRLRSGRRQTNGRAAGRRRRGGRAAHKTRQGRKPRQTGRQAGVGRDRWRGGGRRRAAGHGVLQRFGRAGNVAPAQRVHHRLDQPFFGGGHGAINAFLQPRFHVVAAFGRRKKGIGFNGQNGLRPHHSGDDRQRARHPPQPCPVCCVHPRPTMPVTVPPRRQLYAVRRFRRNRRGGMWRGDGNALGSPQPLPALRRTKGRVRTIQRAWFTPVQPPDDGRSRGLCGRRASRWRR